MSTKLRYGTFRLKTFWFRRLRRLLPAVIATLAAVIFLTAAIEPGSLKTRLMQALSALFYYNNWHTIFAGNSYFDKFQGLGPLDHMWSLSIEEQFYIVWPLLLVILFFVLRVRRRIVAATLLLAGLSFALMWYFASSGMDHTRIYEGTDTRAGGLLCGAALAIYLAYRHQNSQRATLPAGLALVFGVVGIAGIITLARLTKQNGIFLYHGGLILTTLCSVLVIAAALRTQGLFARVLGCVPMRWIGERSYGIYLWHLPVIAFLPRAWMPNATDNATIAWSVSALVCVVSIVLAAVSWTVLENPIRKYGVIEPLRQWWAFRREQHHRGTPQEATMAPRKSVGMIPATCTVVVLALLSIGTPALVSGRTAAQPSDAIPMELPKDAADAPAKPAAATAAADSEPMRCTTVIHVGDSTSIGLFNTAQLPEGSGSGFQTYRNHGAKDVVDSVFGARATTKGFQKYPSAVESVSELLSKGQDPDTCWVIATGVNDAANYAALSDYGYKPNPDEMKTNIRTMLDKLRDYKVMWNTVATYQPSNAYYDNANMELFNKQLLEVADEYENVAVWDWAAEISQHHDWFIPGDGTHYVAEGNGQRAERFASALAKAFPESGSENGNKPAAKVVNS